MRRTSRLITLVLVLVVGLGVYLTAQPGAGGAGYERVLASSGQALRQWDDRITAMERIREMRLRAVQADSLVAGRSHERLDQYYKGVRVVGGEVGSKLYPATMVIVCCCNELSVCLPRSISR